MDPNFNIPGLDWAKGLNCGIMVCNCQGDIIYMNDKAIEAKNGDLTGTNILECHNENSRRIIAEMLATGGENVYTIEKNGIHKIIYQSAWKVDGVVMGLCEFMIVYSGRMPHYVR